jgi:hypothetical protein
MTNRRHAVKRDHERFQVELLLEELNRRHRSNFAVISEPDPPEAIIRSNRTTRWVEVVTVFLNDDFARDVNSFATAGETHYSISGTLIAEPDEQFSRKFVAVVCAKLEKKNYEEFRESHGPGYLLVSIQNPFFGDDTLAMTNEHWRASKLHDLGCFRSIYLTYRIERGYRIRRWVPPRNRGQPQL